MSWTKLLYQKMYFHLAECPTELGGLDTACRRQMPFPTFLSRVLRLFEIGICASVPLAPFCFTSLQGLLEQPRVRVCPFNVLARVWSLWLDDGRPKYSIKTAMVRFPLSLVDTYTWQVPTTDRSGDILSSMLYYFFSGSCTNVTKDLHAKDGPAEVDPKFLRFADTVAFHHERQLAQSAAASAVASVLHGSVVSLGSAPGPRGIGTVQSPGPAPGFSALEAISAITERG